MNKHGMYYHLQSIILIMCTLSLIVVFFKYGLHKCCGHIAQMHLTNVVKRGMLLYVRVTHSRLIA